MNTGDIMVMWLHHVQVMSNWAYTSLAHVHGTCAIIKMGVLKYSNGLRGMPADLNLRKVTASHFNVLITQNTNKNMPNMFHIVYLNENLRYCNENEHGVNKNPSFIPTCFDTQQKVRKRRNTHFTLFTCRYHNF